jgi:hypothetical protein
LVARNLLVEIGLCVHQYSGDAKRAGD